MPGLSGEGDAGFLQGIKVGVGDSASKQYLVTEERK